MTFRVFKSEIKRILSHRATIICSVVILALLIVIITAYFLSICEVYTISRQYIDAEQQNYARQFAQYKARYDYLVYGALSPENENPIGWANETAEYCLKQMQLFSFFLENGTTYAHYVLNVDKLDVIHHAATYVMFGVPRVTFLAAVMITFVLTFFMCENHNHDGTLKNYLAAGVSGTSLSAGRFAALWTVLGAFWLVLFAWGSAAAACGVQDVLYYADGQYRAISSFAVYTVHMLGLLAAMFAASALASFFATVIKNIWVAVFCTLALFAALILSAYLFKQFTPVYYEEAERRLAYFPIVGKYAFLQYSAFDHDLWVDLCLPLFVDLIYAAPFVAGKFIILKRYDKKG